MFRLLTKKILGTLIAAWIVGPPFRNTTRVKAVEIEKESEDDRQRLQGSWEAVRVERNGKALYRGLIASQAKFSFVRDTVIFEEAVPGSRESSESIRTRLPRPSIWS
jgi:hypothetical protein